MLNEIKLYYYKETGKHATNQKHENMYSETAKIGWVTQVHNY